ncbi:cytochrome c oxidase subunit II [Xanthobacteraceae bacterium A53D]
MTLVVVPLSLGGCAGGHSTLDPAGPVAQDIAWLWWIMLGSAGILTVMVLALVAVGFGRARDVPEDRWTLGLGVGFSLVILAVLLVVAIWVGERILPHGDAVAVQAHARQWSWTFTYRDRDGRPVETINVLHIPAGQPVDVRVTSNDVIHSFWVPQLGGKIDAIPGRENRLRIEATVPGTYEGLCAEFCGLEHGAMRFEVIAHDAANWPPANVGSGQ